MSDQAYDFSLPHRQNKLGILVYLIRNFRGLLSLFFALIAISASNPGFWVYLPFILIPVAILGSVLAYLQFRNFTFRIQGDEVIIQKGVFIKETVRIPIDRIQSIQVSEHVVQRILGLVAIRLDTAGSKGNELEIPALNRQLATVLKDYLYQRKAAQDVEDESEFIESIPTVNEEKTLLRLTPIDLLKVGLTENHLRTGIIALAFIFGTFSQYQEYITERFGNEVDVYTDQVVSMGFQIIIFLIVLFAISSIFISTIKVILQFYDLKVVLNAETIEITTGLLKRQEYRIPIRKVQYLVWDGNPLRRMMGYESVKIKPSNSAGETMKKERIEIPALNSGHTAALAEAVFPGFHQPEKVLHANAWAYGRIAGIISFFFLSFIIFPMYLLLNPYALFMYLLLIPIVAIARLYGKSVSIRFDGQFVVIYKGSLFNSRATMHTYKVQAICLNQSVFLRKRKLGHVSLYTAAGELSVRYLSMSELSSFRDFVLYAIERDNRDWM